MSLFADTRSTCQRVEKFAYDKKKEAKNMQDCINVKSSRNNKVRHLARKRKKQEKGKCKQRVKKPAQWTEFIEEIQKVNNPLTKHTELESLQRL